MSRLGQLKHVKCVAQDPAHSQRAGNTRCSMMELSSAGPGLPDQAGRGQRAEAYSSGPRVPRAESDLVGAGAVGAAGRARPGELRIVDGRSRPLHPRAPRCSALRSSRAALQWQHWVQRAPCPEPGLGSPGRLPAGLLQEPPGPGRPSTAGIRMPFVLILVDISFHTLLGKPLQKGQERSLL